MEIIPNYGRKRRLAEYDRELFRNLYEDRKLSQSQIAAEVGLSRACVGRIMKAHRIGQRSLAEASSNMNDQRKVEFSPEQEQLILGSMLGDTALYHEMFSSNKTGKPITTLKLLFAHSIRHHEYLLHKREQLLVPGAWDFRSEVGERISGHGSVIKHFAYSHTPTLKPYAEFCHSRQHKKLISKTWLDKLNWCGVAYWYMDDGSLLYNKRQDTYAISFYTNSFDRREITLLRRMLLSKGMRTTTRAGNKKPDQRIININHQDDVEAFCKMIAPFVVPTMRYKIRVLDNARCPARDYLALQREFHRT